MSSEGQGLSAPPDEPEAEEPTDADARPEQENTTARCFGEICGWP